MRLSKICFMAVFALASLLLTFGPNSYCAEENSWTHTHYFDNDLFNGTDSNYTNGVKYSLIFRGRRGAELG